MEADLKTEEIVPGQSFQKTVDLWYESRLTKTLTIRNAELCNL